MPVKKRICEQALPNKLFTENSAQWLWDILSGWGPADPNIILKRDSLFHNTENGTRLRHTCHNLPKPCEL